MIGYHWWTVVLSLSRTFSVWKIFCYFDFVKFVENLEFFLTRRGQAPVIDSTTKVRQLLYSAPALTELVADLTWSGASDRLYYYGSTIEP